MLLFVELAGKRSLGNLPTTPLPSAPTAVGETAHPTLQTRRPAFRPPIAHPRVPRCHVTRYYRYRISYRIAGEIIEIRNILHPRRAAP